MLQMVDSQTWPKPTDERDEAALAEARAYGFDIGLMNSLLDLPVIERLRRNDADAELDRVLRESRSAAQ
jgi:hypothetical protein